MDPKKVFSGNAAFLADMKFESDQIKRMNFGRARDILMDAQKEAEEIYISGADDIRKEEEKTEE